MNLNQGDFCKALIGVVIQVHSVSPSALAMAARALSHASCLRSLMATTFKGTPGPWVAYPNKDDNCFYIAQQDGAPFTPDYSDVAGLYCNTWSGERYIVQRANAELLSAAHDLLEALQEVVAISDRKHEAWDKARAAIAKALGETE